MLSVGYLTFMTAGGFSGLLSLAFTVWDRFARHRPIVEIVVKKRGFEVYPFLRVTNPGPASIIVKNVTCDPNLFTIGESDTTGSIVRRILGHAPISNLGPGEQHDFPVFPEVDLKEGGGVAFKVHWRKTSSFGFPQIPCLARSSLNSIILQIAAEHRKHEK